MSIIATMSELADQFHSLSTLLQRHHGDWQRLPLPAAPCPGRNWRRC
ncbi:hypothetical protein MBH78_07890 [Oceanimonas sp. NS1]|nr:hypothetical protein [Oceanimonas sp. NS1]